MPHINRTFGNTRKNRLGRRWTKFIDFCSLALLKSFARNGSRFVRLDMGILAGLGI
ncbi:MAG: hypothetical protein HWQ38_13230 [Nostoc sp. NMS7]|uniref:hypothetical protein n=1 Tax=Nostoc sp. NMS7 TaxID=2815391 RepID=UPI0025D6D137|nr:hypothetical protein [Nostoc sp. NMS7]MBN3947370.1 hypothetical protein [Nostoc sp. NMS7]